jgi:CheY-like chemotaxis protein
MNMENWSILLVEDNEADVLLTSQLLAQTSVANTIYPVQDGEAAIHFLLKQQKHVDAVTPDLIILDINLPKLNGKEVLSFIKENDALKMIPVIMYTSSNSEKDILFCNQKKVDLYLIKANSLADFDYTAEVFKNFMLNHSSR